MNAAGQQLSDHGIGASEIAAVVGVSPYRSAFELWEEKIGERAPFDGNDATEWGLLVEAPMRRAYEQKTGQRLFTPSQSMFHPEMPFVRATPDAIVVNDNAPAQFPGPADWQFPVQLKCTGYWPGKSWEHGPPDWVQLQEQWEMLVLGAQPGAPRIDRADVVASIGGGFPQFFTVHRDDSMIDGLVKVARDFWKKVETRTPPKADESDACRDYWMRRARAGAALIVPYVEASAVADAYAAAWKANRATEAALELAKTAIAEVCGGAAAGGIEAADGHPIKLQARAGQRRTNWEYVARMLATKAGVTSDELAALVADNTKTGEPSTAVVAPRAWTKES